MADRAVRERPDESGAAEHAVHQAQRGRAAVLVLGEDRHHHRERRLDEIADQDREGERSQESLVPDEAQPGRELGEETARCLRDGSLHGSGHVEGDERCGEEEARRVQPQRIRRADRGHEHTSDRCADEEGALLDRSSDAARTFQTRSGQLDEVRDERCPCRRAGRVEKRAEKDQGHELPQLDPDRDLEQRDRSDCCGAREIGDDARRAKAEPIDDDAAEETGENEGNEVEEDRKRSERRAPCRRQHEPRDRELRNGIARE